MVPVIDADSLPEDWASSESAQPASNATAAATAVSAGGTTHALLLVVGSGHRRTGGLVSALRAPRRRRSSTSRPLPRARPVRGPARAVPSRLISDTMRCGPAWISTWAITVSRVTFVTSPRKRLRADSDSTGRGAGRPAARGLLGQPGKGGTVDGPAAGAVAGRRHASGIGPAAQRVVADPEQRGCLTDPERLHRATLPRRYRARVDFKRHVRVRRDASRESAVVPWSDSDGAAPRFFDLHRP